MACALIIGPFPFLPDLVAGHPWLPDGRVLLRRRHDVTPVCVSSSRWYSSAAPAGAQSAQRTSGGPAAGRPARLGLAACCLVSISCTPPLIPAAAAARGLARMPNPAPAPSPSPAPGLRCPIRTCNYCPARLLRARRTMATYMHQGKAMGRGASRPRRADGSDSRDQEA